MGRPFPSDCDESDNLNREQMPLDQYVNMQDNEGWTALHHGASNGHVETSRVLIEVGVDPRTTDHHGRTAADVARQNGHTECADYIDSQISIR